MGGGSRQTMPASPTTASAATPVPMRTIQPFMPGFDQTLASQLAMGFGGTPQDYLSQFASIYQPMNVPTQPVIMAPETKKK